MRFRLKGSLIIITALIGLLSSSGGVSYAASATYTYDELNRLLRVEYADGTRIDYAYDEVGNRSQVSVGKYTLTVNVIGNGTVTRNPNQLIYAEGTDVTLTAVNGSQTFTAWSGDLTGSTNPTTITMNGNKSVTATFICEDWLQGWTYRKSVTLSRASGAVTNYQMKLLVGQSAGATGEDVDCGGHVLSNFNDLRFTTSDGSTLLDYWIESITGTTPNQLATIWIKFDSIGTSATTFWMYYGRSDAAAASNGANTFGTGKWDDFEWGSSGNSLSASGGNVTWTVTTGSIQISTTQSYGGTRSAAMINNAAQNDFSFPVTVGTSIALLCKFYKADAVLTTNLLIHGNGSKIMQVYCDSNENLLYYDTSGHTITTFSAGSWHTLEVNNINWSLGTFDVYLDGTLVKSGAGMRSLSSYNNLWRWQQNAYSGTGIYFDNVIVRQYANPEPTWGNWSSEYACP